MSGTRPKWGAGPERPSLKKEPAKKPAADQTPAESASSPALTNAPLLEGRVPVSARFAELSLRASTACMSSVCGGESFGASFIGHAP